jgi:hypothetical protein
MTERKLIYKFQEKDSRDHNFKVEPHPTNQSLQIATITFPSSNMKTSKTVSTNPTTFIIPPANLGSILDQGNLGDCVCNAFSFAINSQTLKASTKVVLSRIFMYAICRCIDYTPLNVDGGTTVRTACKSIGKTSSNGYGIVSESLYPYNINNFNNLPPLNIFQSAKIPKSFVYTFINQDTNSIKSTLNMTKIPIIFGFLVYSSFMTTVVAKTGIVPMPDTINETLEGGHCMCIIGYNDATQIFTCVNSWGTSWGNKGMCYIPYAYLMNSSLASDFCLIQISP